MHGPEKYWIWVPAVVYIVKQKHGVIRYTVYIYIYIYVPSCIFRFDGFSELISLLLSLALQPPNLGLGLSPWNSPFHFGFLVLRRSVGLLERVISSSQGFYLYTNTGKRARAHTHTHTHTQTLNIHALSGIRTHGPGFRASEGSECLRRLGYRDRRTNKSVGKIMYDFCLVEDYKRKK
jgi:hypothetical protein